MDIHGKKVTSLLEKGQFFKGIKPVTGQSRWSSYVYIHKRKQKMKHLSVPTFHNKSHAPNM